MNYTFHLNDRDIRATRAGAKKVEVRVQTPFSDHNYAEIKAGDTIKFISETSDKFVETTVTFLHHYPDVKTMLEKEGIENVLSSEPKTIEHAIESHNSIKGYKEGTLKNGIYAIGVSVKMH